MTITGLVLAAGGSTRLGQPKQLLPFADGTLLGASVARARACEFNQLIVMVGGAAAEIIDQVDLSGTEVVHNTAFGSGCSSSIAAALAYVDPRSDGLILLLGDQPLIAVENVKALIAAASGSPIGACRYRDGLGHPFWLGRELFDRLATLHGDKGVWKLIDAAGDALVTVAVDAEVPIDVDTWDDYHRLQASTLGVSR